MMTPPEKRGFFYSHVGWLLLKKPQAVKDAGKQLNFDDLLAVSTVFSRLAVCPPFPADDSPELGSILQLMLAFPP